MPTSGQLTIRSIGRSLLALLAERLGLAAPAAVEYADLDELAGTWSKSEASRFDEALHAQRQVDPDVSSVTRLIARDK
jgi:hypothetical protein